MSYYYHLTAKSGNAKTGPIPVSTTSDDSCPDTCPLKNAGCYADGGPLALHWRKVSERKRGMDFAAFLALIRKLPNGQLWRHNQAGDIPHTDGTIDREALIRLAVAAKRTRGFTYTHHALTSDNVDSLYIAADAGFVVNASTNNISEALAVRRKHPALPVVTLLPKNAPNVQCVDGEKIVACPAEKSDRVSCATCGLCADAARDYVIGFRVHGSGAKKAEAVARS